MELADLDQLEFASWKNPWAVFDDEAQDHDPDLDKVLTLRRLLETVSEADRRVELAIETKHPTRYAGLVERHLVDLLDRFGLASPSAGEPSRVRVMSFAPTGLRRVHALAPDVPTVLLFRRMPLRFRDGSLPPRVYAAGPAIEIVRAHPGYVARVHDAGHEVHVWTVDDPTDVDFVLGLGVDAIITNRPRHVVAQLARKRA
jgi:glycerophosphoryl diester phosphodiesterase